MSPGRGHETLSELVAFSELQLNCTTVVTMFRKVYTLLPSSLIIASIAFLVSCVIQNDFPYFERLKLAFRLEVGRQRQYARDGVWGIVQGTTYFFRAVYSFFLWPVRSLYSVLKFVVIQLNTLLQCWTVDDARHGTVGEVTSAVGDRVGFGNSSPKAMPHLPEAKYNDAGVVGESDAQRGAMPLQSSRWRGKYIC